MKGNILIAIVIVFFAVGIATGGFYYYLSKQMPVEIETTPTSKTTKETPDVIPLNILPIKQDFLPIDYEILDKTVVLAPYPLSKYAPTPEDPKVLTWKKDNIFFTFYTDKNQNEDIIGYVFQAIMKGKESLGLPLAEKILNNIPSRGWMQSKQANFSSGVGQLSSIVWKIDGDKYYLETRWMELNQPNPYYLPKEKIDKATIIRLEYFSNKNPWLNKIENIQTQELYLYK